MKVRSESTLRLFHKAEARREVCHRNRDGFDITSTIISGSNYFRPRIGPFHISERRNVIWPSLACSSIGRPFPIGPSCMFQGACGTN